MTSQQAVKTFKKSAVPGVIITQFVDEIPQGCSTPDFEKKPVTLTLQEGKNAIFRAVVKGVPAPDVKWTRTRGGMDDPAKYQTFFNNVTSEFILQINKPSADDSDLYRCLAVNEYGEAACSAGLRIIQVGFKRKARYVPVNPADELKKNLQEFRKLLRKRAPAAKPKPLDKEAVWQLLLHADRRDYEKICLKYGIVDFRGMLRKLQEMRKDTESEQGEFIHSLKNFEHIKVNKDGKATFSLEMHLKNSKSKVYLLKDGEKLRYGTGDEYRKHCLRQIGKKYSFIVNDVQPEDAGVYQVRVEDVPVFSTELEAESIPVRFQQPLSDVRCPEEENAIFECVLRTPCYDAVWLHKTHLLEASEKHQISVSPDGLTHQLVIRNVAPSDNGMYTLDTGLCSSNAWLIVEYAKGKRRQGEGDEREKSEQLKGTLPEKDRAKKPRHRECAGDEDHLMDTGMERDGWYRNGQGSSQGHSTDVDGNHRSLGKDGLRRAHKNERMGFGQFSGADIDGDSTENDSSNFGLSTLGGKSRLRPVHGKDSMADRGDSDELGRAGDVRGGGAVNIDMDDGEGVGSQHEEGGKSGDSSYRAAFGGGGRSGATDGSSVLDGLNPDSTRVGDAKGDLFSRTSPRTGTRNNAAGTETAGGMRSPHGKGGLLTAGGVNGASRNREGQIGTPYGKDDLTLHAGGHLDQAGRSGLPYGPGGLPVGDGAISGAGGSSIVEMAALYGPDGQPVGAGLGDAGVAGAGGAGSLSRKGGLPAGGGLAGAGVAGAGGVGSLYGQDGLPAEGGVGGATVGGFGGVGSAYGKDGFPTGGDVTGAGRFASSYGKDGFPAGTGAGGAGAGGLGSPYGKDGLPAGVGVDGAVVGGSGGVGSLYGKDGLPAGSGVDGAGVGGPGRVAYPYGKESLPAGAAIGGAGVRGAGEIGSPYGKDDLPAGAGIGGAGVGGAGRLGSPCGKDGLPARAGVTGAAVDSYGGVDSPYGKDGLPAGAGIGGADVAGAGGAGSPFGKDGLPAGAGVAGVGSPYGKDGLPTGAGAGVAGVGSPYGKDGLPSGAGAGVAGVGSPYGKDGLPAGAGVGVAGVGSSYGKDGLPAGAGVGGAGDAGAGGLGYPYGQGGFPAGAGIGGGTVGSYGGVGSPYGKDGLPAGAGIGGAGAAGIGFPYGKDGLLAGGGAHGAHLAGAGGVGSPYGKDGLPAGGGIGGTGVAGAGGLGSPYGQGGFPAGAGVGGTVCIESLYGKDGLPTGGGIGGAGVTGAGGVGSPYGKDGFPAGAGVGGAGGPGSPYGKDGLPAGGGAYGAGIAGAGGPSSPYGKDGVPAGAGVGGAGIAGAGGVGSPYGKDGLLAGGGAHGPGLAGAGWGVGSPYGKDGLPAGGGAHGPGLAGAGGVGSPYGKDGLPAGTDAGGAGVAGAGWGVGSLYGQDGLPVGAGIGGAGRVGSPYGKDGVPAGAGVGGAGIAGAGGVGSPYGKDGLQTGEGVGAAAAGAIGFPYGKDGLPAGGGPHGASAAGAGGVGFPYGKDGGSAGTGVGGAAVDGSGGVGSRYGKDGLPAGADIGGAGVAGAGGVGSPYGKDGLPAEAGAGVAEVGSPYGKDGLPAGAGVVGSGAGGRVGSPYGKDGFSAGVGGEGGFGSPYRKDGLPAAAGAGEAGVGSPYGKDGLPAGAGVGVAGVGSPYGKDGLPAGAGVGVAGVGSPYGKDGLAAGAGVAGVGSPYGKDGLPAGTGAGAVGAGSPYGKDGLPAGTGASLAGAGSPYGKDGLPAGAGIGGAAVGGYGSSGSHYGLDGLPGRTVAGDARFPFEGNEVAGSHHGRDPALGRAQGYVGGAGRGGFSSEGSGVGGSAVLGVGSPYKNGASAGARAGVGGVGRLGGDERELLSVRGQEGVGGAVGRGGEYGLGSRPGKPSTGGETGKEGTVSDFRGSGNKGSSHDRDSLSGQGGTRGKGRDLGQLGSLYGKNSALEWAGSVSPTSSVDGRSSGAFGQGSLHYGQMADLYGGPPSVNQRKPELGLDLKANDFLKNTESMGNRRRYCLDNLKAPRCHLNKQLLGVRVLKGEPAELSCTVSKEDVTGTWFKDGLKLTSMDGVVFEKEGLVHKLIINKVEDIHAGKYRFEGGDIKTEASIFVEDPPQVDKVLLKNLTSVPTVAKAGEKVQIKIPFEGRLPIRSMWLKDRMELADDTRIRVDNTETFTMLSISSSERKDCGDYKVRLKNDSGVLEINLKLLVLDKPQPPAGPIKVVESSVDGITIQWKPPKDDGGKPLQRYIIERQQVGKNDWVTLGETPRTCTTFTTNKVEQDMSYYFRVRAVNAEGTSDALESNEVKAVGKASPGAPDAPEVVTTSKDSITISWKVPRKTGSSRIVGYLVQKRKKGTMTWLPVNSAPVADKKLRITNLKKGLQYEFRVAAVNDAGTGDASGPSQPACARDPTKTLGPVQDLKVSSSDSSSVTLAWKTPEIKDGSDVKGYEVEVRPSTSLNWTRCASLPVEVTTYTAKGLQAKERYFLRVRALSDSGPGEATELEACLEAAAPVVSPRFLIDDTVKSFLLIKAGNTIRMKIPFEASPDPVVTWLKDGLHLPNQAAITTKDGTTQLLIRAAEFADSGTYTVELQNSLGKRETFSFQVQVTDIPQPPGPICLEENVPNTVTVTWEPSVSEMWESNLYYTVLKRESEKGAWRVVGDLIYNNKFTFTKLIPGRDYYFRVVAKNSLGASGSSETVKPWRIQKPKAESKVRAREYRGVNQNQPPRILAPLKPHVVTTGSECHMSCAVAGHPAPRVTWYKDSRDLTNDPAYLCTNDFGVCSLVILGVTEQDEGQYMIEATNELGRAFSKAFLTIKDSTL